MGGGSAKKITRGLLAVGTGGLSEVARAAGIEKLDPGKPAREAERQAKKQQAQQAAAIKKQQALEKQKIAEETSEIERRRALATRRKSGRSLLVATSPTGVTSLGGTS